MIKRTVYNYGMNLQELDDDCLLLIIKLLNLKDQINLVLLSNRLRRIVRFIWEVKYKKLEMNMLEVDFEDKQFLHFISNINHSVQEINLKCLSTKQYQIIKRLTFPCVRELRFTQCRPFFMTDEDILHFTHIFPNLQLLTPNGCFTGKYISGFRQLKHLTLKYCHQLEFAYVCEILKSLNLATLVLNFFQKDLQSLNEVFPKLCRLEKLSLNTNEMQWITNDAFMNASRLKQLFITDKLNVNKFTILYSILYQCKALQVVSIGIINMMLLPNSFLNNISAFENLRELTFISDFNVVKVISDYVEMMPQLRELIFSNCFVDHESKVVDLLMRSKHLTYISFEFTTMDFLFVNLDVFNISKGRTDPLTFNYHFNPHNLSMALESKFTWVNIIGNDKMFEISCHKCKNLQTEYFSVGFEYS